MNHRPLPKVFTKDSPCTKWEIWHCFRIPGGFGTVQVAIAHSQIGVNVPRVMEREGRLVKRDHKGVEYYLLTEEGEDWLLKGFRNYLKNHPSKKLTAKYVPIAWRLRRRA